MRARGKHGASGYGSDEEEGAGWRGGVGGVIKRWMILWWWEDDGSKPVEILMHGFRV